MIRKYINSNKGSSLIMIVFYMMILMMLGSTIMSLALTNFKMKLVDEDVKKSLYLAESGLEEVHAIIELEVKNAVDYANKKLEDNFDKLKEECTYTDDNGKKIVDKIRLQQKLSQLFETSYKNYLTTRIEGKPPEGNEKEKLIEKINNASYLYNVSIDISEVDEFSSNSDTLSMKITSTYTPIDGIEKSISQRFSIKIPNKDDKYKMNKPYYKQYDTKLYNLNELKAKSFTDNVLTAMGDIIFKQSSKVTVNGSVHAGGKNNGRGIVIKSGTVCINKDNNDDTIDKISTPKNIEIDGKNIKANFNADVFCNTLEITKNSSNSSLIVGSFEKGESNKFRVFTEDDLELNGISSQINIYGSYYGFSDGSSLTSTHDDSSAIIINSIDIGEQGGSSLTITGEKSENNEFKNGILIGGTSYIDSLYKKNEKRDENKKEYQTGESVSIIGNYIAYTDSANKYLDDREKYEYGDYYYFYTDKDSLKLKYVDKFDGKDLKVFNGAGKSKTSIIKEVAKNSDSILNVKGVNLPKDKVIHTTGIYISNGKVDNKFNDSLYNTMKEAIVNKYNEATKTTQVLLEYPSKLVNEIVKEDNTIKLVYINNGSNPITIGNYGKTINISSDREVYGLIINKGDIHISGQINFKGIIASEGSIYFEGSGDKIITYAKDVEVKIVEESLGFENESDISSYKNYSDLIEVRGWKIEK
ncbi:pilus assembly PilX N-terminal domain-containing protein [Caminicella sporogenes]|uniref:pilus assembly PilX N-terminal domain-containing protein n=1 Tax=Caminicella sporogenes TaxID=166485 RepID=UPI0025405186|nr:pilus assembly PilX N-terminal domain-containing protein [Caminicella sporogenes]WIF94520.1 pilus assembly PilX N-terminal domain-containing protein [Caminicella sporogenes]